MGDSSRAAGTAGRFRIAGLNGDADAVRVERALRALRGVEGAVVDLERSEVLVRRGLAVHDTALAGAVAQQGFTLLLAQDDDAPDAPPPDAPPAEPPEPPGLAPFDEPVQEPQSAWLTWRRALTFAWYAVVIFFGASLFFTLAFRFLPVPFTLHIVGEALFDGHSIRQKWMPLEKISPHLVRSVIASEDGEFCNHWGFDFNELRDAWREARNGGRLRGASTISQQTAKNTFLWPARSWARKGLEAYFTVLIELFWPKRRIMEVYLNVIEWGPGVFGAEAASRHWFKKPASRLSPLEAARLAAVLPNPNRYRANPPGPYVNGRSYTIAARAGNVHLYGEDRCARP